MIDRRAIIGALVFVLMWCGPLAAEPWQQRGGSHGRSSHPGVDAHRGNPFPHGGQSGDRGHRPSPPWYPNYPFPVGVGVSLDSLNGGLPYAGPTLRSRASYRVLVTPALPGVASSIVSVTERAADYQASAERWFRDGRYDDALRAVQHAMVEDPDNGLLTLFQAQTLLAVRDYDQAARLLDHAARQLNPEDMGLMILQRARFYAGTSFQDQLDQLAEYTRLNPGAGNAHLLQGYQYLYLGQRPEANAHLTRALELAAYPELAQALLAQLAPDLRATEVELLPPPRPTSPAE